MFSIEEFIIAVFCCVEDLLKEMMQGQPIRARGFAPALSDTEVLTMEIVAEYQGIDTAQAIWQYFRRHWLAWFPGLGSRSAFVRQAANLWQYKALQRATVGCKVRSHCFKAAFGRVVFLSRYVASVVLHVAVVSLVEAAYGYCAAKKQIYYGLSWSFAH